MSWYNLEDSLVMEIDKAPGVDEYVEQTKKRLELKGAYPFFEKYNFQFIDRETKYLFLFSFKPVVYVLAAFWLFIVLPFVLAYFQFELMAFIAGVLSVIIAFFVSPSMIYFTIKGILAKKGIKTKTRCILGKTNQMNVIMNWS